MAQPVRPPQRIATSAETSSGDARFGASRREFLQFLIGGSTLMIGGVFLSREEADALPGPGNTSDVADLGDSLIAVEQPYKYNLVLEVTAHNRVRFELPREDKGQGIATALAMMVAEEMDADYDRVDVELSDRRADRPTTITGGSSTIRTMWEPARTVAANARLRLVTAAANRWGLLPTDLRVAKSMVIHDGSGRRASFGELSAEAAALALPVVPLPLKAIEDHTIVGTSRGRKNARAIVTGQQKYTMDLGPEDGVPANATPAVVARPPDIKGYVVSINNQAAVEAMPGVVGVVQIDLPDRAPVPLGATFPQPTGVAVAADTFHHAFAARDALDITWGAGPMAGESSDDHLATLESIALPLTPVVPPNESFTASFDFPYVAHAPLEVMGAVADVQGTDSATIWFPSQTPNHVCGQIAAATGVADANVTMHVPFAGGAFGRRLFGEPAVEAAVVSQALGRPIKLLWSRNDDMRHGRFRPMTHHDIRATWLDGVALTFEHRVAAAETDLRHGYGDAIFGPGYTGGNAEVDQAAFGGTVSVPYEFGVTSQLMITQHFEVPTCSWRSIHSGFTMTANEIFVDALARARRRRGAVPPRPPRGVGVAGGAGGDPRPREGGRDGRLGPRDAGRARAGRRGARRVPLGRGLPRRDRHDRRRAAPDGLVRGGRRRRADQPPGPRSADRGRARRRLVGDVPRQQPPRERRDRRGQLRRLPVVAHQARGAHHRGLRLRRDERHARRRRRARPAARLGGVRERLRARHRHRAAPLPDPGIPPELRGRRCPRTP